MNDWLGQVLGFLALLVSSGLLARYLFERKRDKAAEAVAERTVDAQVDLTSISAVEAHVALVERAFESERTSKDRVIADLEKRLAEADLREAKLTEKVTRLQTQVEELQQKLTEVQRELADLVPIEET